MKILALDTSTHWLSVACGVDGQWHERSELAGQLSSERVLPLVRTVLDEAGCGLADLTGIAFGAGPGSFTGVRIACGVAQGLAYAHDLPVVPITTLAALAHAGWQAHGAKRILACLDARMREVYVAAYELRGDVFDEVMAPDVLAPAAVHRPAGDAADWFGVGDGFAAYPDLAERVGLSGADAGAHPQARAVAELAQAHFVAGTTLRAEDAHPLYVRHRVALSTAQLAAGQRM